MIELYSHGTQLSSADAMRNVEQYARQQVAQMERGDTVLLAAALLPQWTDCVEEQPEYAALDLPSDYLQRIEAYGWPLEYGAAVQPHPLLRDAMLKALERKGQRSGLEERLAEAVQHTHPVWAMELRSQRGDVQRALQLAREYLPRWTAQGQWMQLIASLQPYFLLLTLPERLLLLRAHLETAVNHAALRQALVLGDALLAQAREEPQLLREVGLLRVESLLRLGRVAAARQGLEELLALTPTPAPGLMAWYALITLQAFQPERALEYLTAHRAARVTVLGQAVYAAALLQTGEPERGRQMALSLYEHLQLQPKALLNEVEHIRAAFLLCALLSDCAAPQEAQALLALLPTRDQGYWFEVRIAHLRGLLAWRQFDEDAASQHFAQAASAARTAQDDELLTEVLQSAFLSSIYFCRYRAAEHLRTEVIHLAASESHLEEWVYESGAVLRLLRLQAGGDAASRAASPREIGLVLRRVSGDVRTQDYPEGQRLLWENWQPLPEDLSYQSLTPVPKALSPDFFFLADQKTQHHLALTLMGNVETRLRARVDGEAVALSEMYITLLSALALGPQAAAALEEAVFSASKNPSAGLRTGLSRIRAAVQRSLQRRGGDVPDLITRAERGVYRLGEGWTISVDAQEFLQGCSSTLVSEYQPLIVPVAVQRERLTVLNSQQFDKEVIALLEQYRGSQQALRQRAELGLKFPDRF